MSPLAAAFPSPCCAGDYRLVNAGATHRTYTAAVVACAACGAEWALRLDAYRVSSAPAGAGKARRCQRTDQAEGDALAAAVLDVVTSLKENAA